MASGGVASPTDRLENLQFSEEELRAIVEEANNAKIYCAAHAYTDEAIERAVRCGVRSIEHGNFAKGKTLQMMHDKDVFLVPTLITYDRLTKEGVAGGMPQELVDKVGNLVEEGQRTVKQAIDHNVRVCYGSDLLGDMHKWQAHGIDLHLRAGVSNSDLLKSLVRYPNYMIWGYDIGSTDAQIPPDCGTYPTTYLGCRADLLVVKGDVTKDPRLLMDPENIKVIIKKGKIVKNELGFKNQEQADSSAPDGKDQTIEAKSGQSKRARR
jgi:imidazolonepropionase-like amidohydrolase